MAFTVEQQRAYLENNSFLLVHKRADAYLAEKRAARPASTYVPEEDKVMTVQELLASVDQAFDHASTLKKASVPHAYVVVQNAARALSGTAFLEEIHQYMSSVRRKVDAGLAELEFLLITLPGWPEKIPDDKGEYHDRERILAQARVHKMYLKLAEISLKELYGYVKPIATADGKVDSNYVLSMQRDYFIKVKELEKTEGK